MLPLAGLALHRAARTALAPRGSTGTGNLRGGGQRRGSHAPVRQAASGPSPTRTYHAQKNGLEVTRLIRQESPTTDVLILTMHFSEEVAREVLRCGARGYLLKSDSDVELLAAVRHIQHHKPFFTDKLAVTMAESFVRDTGGRTDNSNNKEAPLSARELEVVQLLASRKSNKEAAAIIGVSTRTVESHRKHIMHKMDFGSFSDPLRHPQQPDPAVTHRRNVGMPYSRSIGP